MIQRHAPHVRGEIAEMQAALFFMEQGLLVSKPVGGCAPYDLVIDDGTRLYRVEVKRATMERRGQCYQACVSKTVSVDGRPRSAVRTETLADLLFIIDADGRMYVFPGATILGRHMVTVRPEQAIDPATWFLPQEVA